MIGYEQIHDEIFNSLPFHLIPSDNCFDLINPCNQVESKTLFVI